MKEIWKDILGYIGLYQVSNFGRVKSLERMVKGCGGSLYKIKERILKPGLSSPGYLTVSLWKNNEGESKLIHILVLETFGSKKPSKKYRTNHKDGNKKNNNSSNLEWATQSENVQHAYRTGLTIKGILPIKKRKEIRKTYSQGRVTQEFLAKKYGVSIMTISNIIHNKIAPRDF